MEVALVQLYLADVLAHHLDHVGHGEVHDVVAPGELEDGVGSEEVVALEERRGEALVIVVLKEPRQQLLRNLDLARLRRVLHGVLLPRNTTMYKVHVLLRLGKE